MKFDTNSIPQKKKAVVLCGQAEHGLKEQAAKEMGAICKEADKDTRKLGKCAIQRAPQNTSLKQHTQVTLDEFHSDYPGPVGPGGSRMEI